MGIFVAICPLIWRDLAATWNTNVVAVDASDWGLGAVSANLPNDDVVELGKFSERWRFDFKHLSRPREHSFGIAIAADSQEAAAAAWAANEAEAGSVLPPIQVVPPKRFDQIFTPLPFSTVDRTWKVCGRYRWKRAEPIPVLEARASLFAIKHFLRSTSSVGKRVLILSDSISSVCALDNGRGRSFKMRRVSQQVAALTLGANLQPAYRWLPSEWNPADGPSRGSKFPSKPVLNPLGSHDTSADRGRQAQQNQGRNPRATGSTSSQKAQATKQQRQAKRKKQLEQVGTGAASGDN